MDPTILIARRRETVNRPSIAQFTGDRTFCANLGLVAKRAFDVGVSVLALPFLLPIFVAITIAIKLDSAGPIFYMGRRTGRFGKSFGIIKFRTMVRDAEIMGGGTTALQDVRVTRVGAFLRKHKLDELPQVFNVLRGHMSLVGPRPELPRYTSLYTGEELLILTVRPGITDYSSIQFSSLDEVVGPDDADRVFEEEILPIKNRLRVKYVRERTFWGDVVLVFRTVLAILREAR